MILVDSSVWIDFFRGRPSDETDRLAALMQDGTSPIAIADMVLFEVLRGFVHEQDFQAAQRALAALPVVELGGEDEALAAVRRWRALRARGWTVASTVDALQASWCIDNGAALLHADADFEAFERQDGLRVWRH